jgi:hypothetical protein
MVARRPSARARRRTRWYDPMARRCLSPCDGFPSGALVLSTANPPDAIVPDGRRRRHVAAAARARSPEERLLAMEELLARSRAVLEVNPAGRAHFLRRNFRARAVTVSPDHVRHGA